jgi:hypothetical protein
MKKIFSLIMLFTTIVFLVSCNDDEENPPSPPSPAPEPITDKELMDTVQHQTFTYFWDFADPNSGMIKERSTTPNTVTTGGSGFGVMVILVGIERGYITRDEGLDRVIKMVNFLKTADRFHGVWPHWLDPNTGKTLPFSTYDDGGDLVETSFMIEGLLTAKEYFDGTSDKETQLRNDIQQLWEEVEWDWYRQNGQNVLYWHWSPHYDWQMNMQISGWNEALITYVLAASSPTHSIPAEVYHEGWAKNGEIINGNNYLGVKLPLGEPWGGPLFYAHYSFLGLNPNGLNDQYADYFLQNKNHTLINFNYCVDNPNNFYGYSDKCWGLTASDDPDGYAAHHPQNDNGTITPTAAISSIVYTPEQSLNAMRYFYETLKGKIWGDYGFTDAFNQQRSWYATSFLAIDQGPIIIMIENYRSGLLWNYFMKNNDVHNGLDKLGFTYNSKNEKERF